MDQLYDNLEEVHHLRACVDQAFKRLSWTSCWTLWLLMLSGIASLSLVVDR